MVLVRDRDIMPHSLILIMSGLLLGLKSEFSSMHSNGYCCFGIAMAGWVLK